MTIAGKNHHAENVEVLTSQASREMAKPPALKFADHRQERDFWLCEKKRLETVFTEMREEHARNLRKISAEARDGKNYFAMKSAADMEFAERLKAVKTQSRQVEEQLLKIKLKLRQQYDREQNAAGVAVPKERVDLGPVMLEVLSVLREIRDILQEGKSA